MSAPKPSAQDKLGYTVNEFCALHGISRPKLYVLWKEGRGPRVIRLSDGPQAGMIITAEAAAEWRRTMTTDHQER